ncbi:hypothetical protein ESA94_12010 [Lacibacter luteus]|uniref:Lipoprotein n=1 Tax=Lacibacter luteus TaxID=2508719 RepID=A0A4Q1CHH3_9BACT|nr:hypothetical protein [Lacibacter luteus]RXK59777.1 hypothetical protein ESA94_12010 [Lacibacter luteus]
MKKMIFYSLLVVFFLSCGSADKKLFIKSMQLNTSVRVDWYFYSLVSNFSRSYIQISKSDTETKFFESFYISDFNFRADTLAVQLYKNGYKIDSAALLQSGFKIIIDTTGGIWNQASSRLGRLQRRNIECSKPHFEDSHCPKNECY